MTDAAAVATPMDRDRHELQLETPRLLLRDFAKTDIEALERYWREPESHANVLRRQRDPIRMDRTLRGHVLYNEYAAWPDRELHELAVCLRDEGTVIGTCGFHYLDRRSVIIGWHYGIAHAGRGYATEAADALLRFAFTELDLHRAFADCFATNLAVLGVLRKLGMHRTRSGWARDWWRGLRYGELRPAIRHVVHRDDFAPAATPT